VAQARKLAGQGAADIAETAGLGKGRGFSRGEKDVQ
jgi:hypothetical protein